MLRTLRSRLIASHVGLLLIVIPLLGVALVYVLESQIVLQNLARQLTGQAVLVVELLRQEPDAMRRPAQAADFVTRISPLFPGQLMLFDAEGVLLASGDPADAALVGQALALPGMESALRGQQFSRVLYSRDQQAEVADVLVPVVGDGGGVLAVVRISDYLSTARQRFAQLRAWIAGVLVAGIVLGALIGYLLAVTVERPLLRLTHAVEAFPSQTELILRQEEGPQEVRMLARAFGGMLDRIHALEENRRHLLSNVVHELGRPLGALRAAGRALLDGAADEPELSGDLLAGMDGEIARMKDLLDELSNLHDLAATPVELRRRPVKLAAWLPQVLGPWRAAALAAGLEWEAIIAPNLPEALVDPDRLAQALGNVLSNAIKFTPAGGFVQVRSEVEAGAWIVRVSDTGPGISGEAQARIFEPFYRDPPDRHYPQGLGLGLTIAADLVRAHGGEITVESDPGRGACFVLRIPLVELRDQSEHLA